MPQKPDAHGLQCIIYNAAPHAARAVVLHRDQHSCAPQRTARRAHKGTGANAPPALHIYHTFIKRYGATGPVTDRHAQRTSKDAPADRETPNTVIRLAAPHAQLERRNNRRGAVLGVLGGVLGVVTLVIVRRERSWACISPRVESEQRCALCTRCPAHDVVQRARVKKHVEAPYRR